MDKWTDVGSVGLWGTEQALAQIMAGPCITGLVLAPFLVGL